MHGVGDKSGDSEFDSEQCEDKIGIGQHYKKPVPEPEWLQESNIKGNNIKEWWKNKDQLTVDGVSFAEFVGGTKAPNRWRLEGQGQGVRNVPCG